MQKKRSKHKKHINNELKQQKHKNIKKIKTQKIKENIKEHKKDF